MTTVIFVDPAELKKTDEAALQQMRRATAQLIIKRPFYASILLMLERVCAPYMPTMATDGKRLFYNPWFVLTLEFNELVGVLCHEADHVALLHPFRLGHRKMEPFNIACDKVVNHYVQADGLTLPKGCIPGVGGKSVEELYDEKETFGNQGAQCPQCGGQIGNQPQPGGGPPPPQGKGQGKGKGQGQGGNQPQGPQAGGGQGQQSCSCPHQGVADPGGCGGVLAPMRPDGTPVSTAEMTELEADARVAVQQALNQAKAAGKIPAGMETLIDEAMKARVPWRDMLSRFVDHMCRNDYSWMRPNRKYMQRGFVLPSLWNRHLGDVIFAGDTSGSMPWEMIKQLAGEGMECLELYQERGEAVEMMWLWFDHAVYPVVVEDADDLKRPQGRGGTSFRVVFDWIREHADRTFAGIVVMTDGYCEDFGEAPEVPVLWILTTHNTGFKPPFGEIACILDDRA